MWVDYSFLRTFFQSVRRALERIRSKEELWEGTGNRETFRNTFFSRDSLLVWLLRTYPKKKRQYSALMQDARYSHIRFIRIRSPRELRVIMEKLREGVHA